MDATAKHTEQRLFPRMQVRVPVVYRPDGAADDCIGVTVDFSATGLRMFCREAVEPGRAIHVEVKPGLKRTVPPIRAEGQVMRCEPARGGGFFVSCRLLKILK